CEAWGNSLSGPVF
nr:immunoglobulin light chain junction region [Macaca mulatta]MPN80873.1 immunoglobulin light chain junction region [Macaca mulatta]